MRHEVICLSGFREDGEPVRPVGSSGNFAALLSGRMCDPRAFRRAYPDRWREFLRAHFHSALHVAVFFDVDERTVRHWWEGTTAPQAWVIAFAIQAVPGARQFLAEAA